MRKFIRKATSLILTGAFLTGVFSTGLMVRADTAAATDLALNKAVTLTITGGGTDNDPQGVTKPDGSTYTVAEVEQASISRLTDGVKMADSGSVFESNWVAGKWNDPSGTRSKYVQFYRNMSRMLDIDLGQDSNVSTLSMSFGECQAYGISAPTSVSYYVSEDGANYFLAGTVTSDEATPETVSCTGDTPMSHVYYKLSGLNYNIRYVKICFDVGVWLFADEIEVMGTASPSSSANPFPTTPYIPQPIVNAYANTSQSGGVRNETLAYEGWYYSGTSLLSSIKTKQELMSNIAYVDGNGTPTAWLFDSVTFLNHGYDDKGRYVTYQNGVDDAAKYTDKQGWEDYLNYIFDYTGTDGTSYNLDALDKAVGEAKQTINDPGHKVGVKIAIMPAVQYQSNWGQLVDGQGKSLDFTVAGAGSEAAALANRTAAEEWYINQVITRFEQKNYQNITFEGFYYYDETVRLSTDPIAAQTIEGLTNAVHSAVYTVNGQTQPLYVYWIPYYQAEGCSQWKAFGFDYAIMQPNYAFYSSASSTRIADCAALCQKYGLGMEMELGGLDDNYIGKFKDYLLQGASLGYQNSSLLAWYTGTWALYQSSTNANGDRYIYDAIYQFIQGKTITFNTNGANLTTGKSTTLTYDGTLLPAYAGTYQTNTADLSALTNGSYGTDAAASYVRLNANYFQDKAVTYTAAADLQGAYSIGALSAVFYQRTGWGINTPPQVDFQVSDDGVNWTDAGTVAYAQASQTGITTVNTASPSYRMTYALTLSHSLEARYVRATFGHNSTSGTWMYMDELEAYGAAVPGVTAPSAVTANIGTTAKFSVTASTTDNGTLSYQWQELLPGAGDWTDISGATSSAYATGALAYSDNGTQLRCVVTNTLSAVSAVAESPAAILTVNPPAVAPAVSALADVTVKIGTKAAFTVTASASDNGVLSYQWQISKDGGKTWTDISGAAKSAYTTRPLTWSDNGQLYRCVVTNSKNNTTAVTDSNASVLSVKLPHGFPWFRFPLFCRGLGLYFGGMACFFPLVR